MKKQPKIEQLCFFTEFFINENTIQSLEKDLTGDIEIYGEISAEQQKDLNFVPLACETVTCVQTLLNSLHPLCYCGLSCPTNS